MQELPNYPSCADFPKVHAAVQWAEQIMRKIDQMLRLVFPAISGQSGKFALGERSKPVLPRDSRATGSRQRETIGSDGNKNLGAEEGIMPLPFPFFPIKLRKPLVNRWFPKIVGIGPILIFPVELGLSTAPKARFG
jgi:hypothetical protein